MAILPDYDSDIKTYKPTAYESIESMNSKRIQYSYHNVQLLAADAILNKAMFVFVGNLFTAIDGTCGNKSVLPLHQEESTFIANLVKAVNPNWVNAGTAKELLAIKLSGVSLENLVKTNGSTTVYHMGLIQENAGNPTLLRNTCEQVIGDIDRLVADIDYVEDNKFMEYVRELAKMLETSIFPAPQLLDYQTIFNQHSITAQ